MNHEDSRGVIRLTTIIPIIKLTISPPTIESQTTPTLPEWETSSSDDAVDETNSIRDTIYALNPHILVKNQIAIHLGLLLAKAADVSPNL